jgi:cytochrome P450
VLAQLRAFAPVAWVPAFGGWLVTGHELALRVMREPSSFTVDDPRFSTAQVIGASMLSLDGTGHARHRSPFVASFRPLRVRESFAAAIAAEATRLLAELEPHGAAELRRSFAGPLAASIITRALGLPAAAVPALLRSYDAIVAAVTSITQGRGPTEAGAQAFEALDRRLHAVLERDEQGSVLAAARRSGELTGAELVSNAAVLLFGAVESTEGMICNAVLHLLTHEKWLEQIRQNAALLDATIEESLRLEPAAAMVDRYATANARLGAQPIGAGQLVRVSIAAANRDPAVFDEPDRFEPRRRNLRRHLAFAQGPHVCLGVHLARLETRIALASLIERLPRLRLDPARPAVVRGLVFRKPPALHVRWD